MNEELLILMRRVAVATEQTAEAAEQTSRHVCSIKWILLWPILLALTVGGAMMIGFAHR